MNSNRKGKEGERELANLLKDRYGYDCRRGQQFCGSNGDADVVGLPGIHIECKRVEKLNIYEAVEQSINDAREGEIPTVMHRKNHKDWLVTMTMCKIDDADSEREWIPVTEKLPEDERNVLLTLESTNGNGYREYSVGCYIQVFDEDTEKHWLDRQYGYLEWDKYSNGHGGCSLYRVTAWMPIPNLYKG